VPVRGKACQGSTQPVYASKAPAHGTDQQLCRAHATACRHIAQDSLRYQKRGRNEEVWHADDVLSDMGAERGKRVRDVADSMLHNLLFKAIFGQDYPNLGRLCNMLAAENTRGDLTGYNSFV